MLGCFEVDGLFIPCSFPLSARTQQLTSRRSLNKQVCHRSGRKLVWTSQPTALPDTYHTGRCQPPPRILPLWWYLLPSSSADLKYLYRHLQPRVNPGACGVAVCPVALRGAFGACLAMWRHWAAGTGSHRFDAYCLWHLLSMAGLWWLLSWSQAAV